MHYYEYEKEYGKGDKALLQMTKCIIWGYAVMSGLAHFLGSDTKAVLFAVWAVGIYLVRRSYIETIHNEIDADFAEQERQAADEILSRWSNENLDKFTKETQDSNLSK